MCHHRVRNQWPLRGVQAHHFIARAQFLSALLQQPALEPADKCDQLGTFKSGCIWEGCLPGLRLAINPHTCSVAADAAVKVELCLDEIVA